MSETEEFRPLPERMRPAALDQFSGQKHLVGEGKPLRAAIESGRLHSMIFWGPPGTGKTTLARIIASQCKAEFVTLSAVLSGVKDIRGAIELAKQHRELYQRDTVLFVDEVHRFNKSQQDAFLPFVEDGTVTFIGATTENPSFELNNALLSRARVYVLKSLDESDIEEILRRAVEHANTQSEENKLKVDEKVYSRFVQAADGDARRALNYLEIASDLSEDGELGESLVEEVLAGGATRRFDKGGDAFYDQISALHKSVRGSSPDAALYWFARMLDGGCDPLYVARRVVRMASEDIGIADPRAVRMALDAWEVQQRLGSPEGELAIAQAIVFLACAPKSNALYKGFNKAMASVEQSPSYDVPAHLKNAPTSLMKKQGHGKNYRYAHDEPDAYAAGENYFPDELKPERYYYPVNRGLEIKIAEKLAQLRELDKNAKQ